MSGRIERGARRSHGWSLYQSLDAPGRSDLLERILGRITRGRPRPDLKPHGLASIDQFPLELSHSVDVALDGCVCLTGESQNRPGLEAEQVAYPNVASGENGLDLERSRVQRVEQGPAIGGRGHGYGFPNLLGGQADQNRRNNETYGGGRLAQGDFGGEDEDAPVRWNCCWARRPRLPERPVNL